VFLSEKEKESKKKIKIKIKMGKESKEVIIQVL
jgi:hypothetical protein